MMNFTASVLLPVFVVIAAGLLPSTVLSCHITGSVAACSGSGLTSLTAITGERSIVKQLYLDGNRITSLSKGGFQDFDNLISLFLNRSQIADVEEGAFEGLSHLQHLYISGNNIQELHCESLCRANVIVHSHQAFCHGLAYKEFCAAAKRMAASSHASVEDTAIRHRLRRAANATSTPQAAGESTAAPSSSALAVNIVSLVGVGVMGLFFVILAISVYSLNKSVGRLQSNVERYPLENRRESSTSTPYMTRADRFTSILRASTRKIAPNGAHGGRQTAGQSHATSSNMKDRVAKIFAKARLQPSTHQLMDISGRTREEMTSVFSETDASQGECIYESGEQNHTKSNISASPSGNSASAPRLEATLEEDNFYGTMDDVSPSTAPLAGVGSLSKTAPIATSPNRNAANKDYLMPEVAVKLPSLVAPSNGNGKPTSVGGTSSYQNLDGKKAAAGEQTDFYEASDDHYGEITDIVQAMATNYVNKQNPNASSQVQVNNKTYDVLPDEEKNKYSNGGDAPNSRRQSTSAVSSAGVPAAVQDDGDFYGNDDELNGIHVSKSETYGNQDDGEDFYGNENENTLDAYGNKSLSHHETDMYGNKSENNSVYGNKSEHNSIYGNDPDSLSNCDIAGQFRPPQSVTETIVDQFVPGEELYGTLE